MIDYKRDYGTHCLFERYNFLAKHLKRYMLLPAGFGELRKGDLVSKKTMKVPPMVYNVFNDTDDERYGGRVSLVEPKDDSPDDFSDSTDPEHHLSDTNE